MKTYDILYAIVTKLKTIDIFLTQSFGKAYTEQSEVTSAIVDKIYPVGAIYISTVNTSPVTLFGGKWESIEGRFLLGASNIYVAGTIGGYASPYYHKHETKGHTHNMNHTHKLKYGNEKVADDSMYIMGSPDNIKLNNIKRKFPNTGGDHYMLHATEWIKDVSGVYSMKINDCTDKSQSAQETIKHAPENNNSNTDATYGNLPPYVSVYMWKRTS